MLRFRIAPLRAAALLAGAFVGIRVMYRVVFGGASGGGQLLVDLPRLPLGGPFSHVALFGPVTTGGLGNAALSALPFALVILTFGLLNALIDVRRLFARGADRGPLRALSRSLVIAWATFPALIESVRRVRTAGALRGERSAPALLVPVFEQTVERALCLAASMEVRGFAANRTAPAECEKPVVMTDAFLGFEGPGENEHGWHLTGLTLDLAPGTLTVIVGSTGSGKTSLLHSLSGLFQHFDDGTQHGWVVVGGVDRAATPPRETAGFVGLVSQNVRLSFVAETVRDEIGFALAVRGVAAVIVEQRVREVAERLQIEHLLARGIDALSAGEASLVAIGAALINRPILLLVDEPLADLDTPARERVVQVLERLAHEARVCVVVAEHNTREWESAADAWLEVRGARVHALGPGERPSALVSAETAQASAATAQSTEVSRTRSRATATGPAERLAGIRHLTVLHGSERAVDDVSLELWAGDLVALEGRNGAGKSSLLRAIALPSNPGSVIVAGRDVAAMRRRDRRTAVALVPENFDDLLFAVTVAEECRRADRRQRPAAGAGTAARFANLLGLGSVTEAARLMRRHPRDLSAGERLCLVMAIQLAAEPRLLLVDEPTRGLDPEARVLVAAALLRASSDTSAVLFATHDRDFARCLATRTVVMAAGLLAEPEPVRP
ncbi:ATP-binding cassette domain-containing protein [Cryobacterium cryoconiti]|uniref:ATP-binding cassette domain-containing protein n=1 Tax=Cryobacterium cryoconiti TaxID=1259239 RepID=A0A4Y8K580_9MICO|nr:ATP-binding cassette domain-containing protein [Cryobacterium cryoconiti]TFD34238.1 ATP-binding cassette domain-containing protein [Cryobacterium cryoconiti]